MPDSKSDHVMKKAKVSTGSDKREKEQEKFYILERLSLDYATIDARRLRFLEYPQASAAEQRALASLTPTACLSSLFFLLSS